MEKRDSSAIQTLGNGNRRELEDSWDRVRGYSFQRSIVLDYNKSICLMTHPYPEYTNDSNNPKPKGVRTN